MYKWTAIESRSVYFTHAYESPQKVANGRQLCFDAGFQQKPENINNIKVYKNYYQKAVLVSRNVAEVVAFMASCQHRILFEVGDDCVVLTPVMFGEWDRC